MKHAALAMIVVMTACGEPDPSTMRSIKPDGAILDTERPRAESRLSYALEDRTGLVCASGKSAGQIHDEVLRAECESYPVKLLSSDNPSLKLTLESVDFQPDDSWNMVPGALIPGLVPFGPLGFWWFYKDISVDTPSLTTHVCVEHASRRIDIDITVVRAVDTQEDLLRSALSESSRVALSWLYPEKT